MGTIPPPTHTTPTPPTSLKEERGKGKAAGGEGPFSKTRAVYPIPHWVPVFFLYIYIKSLTPALYPKRAPDHRKWWSDFIYIGAKGRIMIYVNNEISTVREDEA